MTDPAQDPRQVRRRLLQLRDPPGKPALPAGPTDEPEAAPRPGRRRLAWVLGIAALAGVVLLLRYHFGDGVRAEAWSLERDAEGDLLTEVTVTVERHGEGYPLPPRRITEFEAQLARDVDPEAAGKHLAELAADHGRLPNLHVARDDGEGDVQIRAFQHYSSNAGTAELPAEGWAEVIRMAREQDVLEISVAQIRRDSDSTTVGLAHWKPLQDEALETLESWEKLEPPEGADGFYARMESGLPQEPLERTEESPWLMPERVHVSGPLDLKEGLPARELLESALSEERFEEVEEFTYRWRTEMDAVCVKLGLSGHFDDIDLQEDGPPEELLAAAEEFADLVEEHTASEAEIDVGPRLSYGEVLRREAPSGNPCA